MANKFWLGASTDLSDTNNWSLSEGGAGGAGVPAEGDNACFSATSSSGAATATADFGPDNVYMKSADTGGTDDWDGTLDMATYGIACSDFKNFADSTIDFGSGTHALTGNVTLDGTIDMASSTVDCGGNWNSVGVDTWTQGTSSITMSGTGKTVTTGVGNFNIFNVTGTVTTVDTFNVYGASTISGTLTIDTGLVVSMKGLGALTLTGGTIDGAGQCNWWRSNTLPADGTIDCNFIFRSGTILTARTYGANLTILQATTGTLSFTVSAGTLAIGGDFIASVNTETLELHCETNNPTVNVTGNVDFSDTDGTFSVNMGASTWVVSGNVTFAGVDTLTPGTASFKMTGSTKSLTLSGNTLANLTINASGTVSFADAAAISGTLDIDAGTLDMNGQIADLADITSSGGIITFGSATHTLSGDVDLSGLSSYTATALTFDGASTQSINLDSGTVTTVTVTNSGDVVTFIEDFTATNFVAITPSSEINITSAKTITVSTSLKIYGNASDDVIFKAVTGGAAAFLNATAATREMGYVTLQDINNNSGSNITVSYGTDTSNNTNFDFIDAFVWDGGGGDESATTGANWVGDLPPTTGNPIRFDATSTKDCTYDLTFSITNLDVVSGYSGTITQGEDLDATTNVTLNDGTFVMIFGKGFNVDGNLTVGASATLTGAATATMALGANLSIHASASVSLSNVPITLNGSGVQDIALSDETVLSITNSNTSAIVTFSEGFTATTFTSTGVSSMKFQSGETFVATTFVFSNGTAAATTPSSAWLLNNVTSNSVSGVTVSDSDASAGIEIVASSSTDSGGNTNWSFGVVDGPGIGAGPGGDKEAILMDAFVCGDNIIRLF